MASLYAAMDSAAIVGSADELALAERQAAQLENRAVDAMGLMPSTELGNTDKIGFLEWYQLWLNQALSQQP